MLTYISFIYRLSCALPRTALWYVSLYPSTCNSVRGLTCYDVRQVGVVLSERGLGIGWCGGGVFMVGGVSAGLQRFYLGDMECSSFRWVFFKNSA